MNDLITWLRAQLDEDERAAQAAIRPPDDLALIGRGPDDGVWEMGWLPEQVDGVGITIHAEGDHTVDQARHIVRWNPARVLTEIDAKRRILAHIGMVVISPGREALPAEYVAQMELFLRLLALPYADREGYRDEEDESHE